MSHSRGRNLQLDILRGVAVFLVFGRHLEIPKPEGIMGVLADAWYQLGWLGVDLFFVLSGFLIGGLLITEAEERGRIDIPRFLLRRGMKIYPMYIVFIAYVVLAPMAKLMVRGGDGFAAFADLWTAYWPNLLFLQNYVGSNPEGHTWTLAVEEHFYLMLPFALSVVVWAGRMRSLASWCLLGAPVFFLAVRSISVFTDNAYAVKMAASHLRLDALLFGVGMRSLAQYLPGRFESATRWRGWLVAVGLSLWSVNLFVNPSTVFARTIGLTGTYLGSSALLLAAFHTHGVDFGPWARFARPVASLIGGIGVYSYGIYVWHVTVMGGLNRLIGRRFVEWAGGMTPTLWLACAMLLTLGAVGAGIVATKVVEWPVLRIRDRFFPSRSRPLPAVTPGAPAASERKVLQGA